MQEEYDVRGAEVIFSTAHKTPYNPLRRPKISYRNFAIALALFVLLVLFTVIVGRRMFSSTLHPVLLCVLFSAAAAAIYLLLIAKRAVIWMVHVYQNKASDERRLMCVYEPSCSEYMILAVKKYGAIRGVVKGCRRLCRCHAPNGGIDFP